MTAPAKAKNGKRKKEAPYYWFEGGSVNALRDQLNAAGAGARLEVRIAKGRMLLRVVPPSVGGAAPAKADASNDINDSFLCPPRCP